MKKIVGLLLALVLVLPGCSSGNSSVAEVDSEAADTSVVAENTVPEEVEPEEEPEAEEPASVYVSVEYHGVTFEYSDAYSYSETSGSAAVEFEPTKAFFSIMAQDTGFNIKDEIEKADVAIEDLLDVSLMSLVTSLEYSDLEVTYPTIDGQTGALATCTVDLGSGSLKKGEIYSFLVGSMQYYITYFYEESLADADVYYEEYTKLMQSISFDMATVADEEAEENGAENGAESGAGAAVSSGVTFGSTIEFMDFRITFGAADSIEWSQVENRFSDRNGEDVIMLPIQIENIGDDTGSLRRTNFTVFGSAGIELDSVSSFFSDYDVTKAGDMRPGASMDSYFCFLYDGDGEYIIEFSKRGEDTVEVSLPVTK